MPLTNPGWLWLVIGGLLFGAMCGAVLRLLSFLVVAVLAVAVLAVLAVIGAAPGGAIGIAMTAFVALQVGYGLGVMARAELQGRWRRRGTSAIKPRSRR